MTLKSTGSLTHLCEILENTNFSAVTESKSAVAWGGGKKERLMEQDTRDHWGVDGNILYVDSSGTYMAVYIFSKLTKLYI